MRKISADYILPVSSAAIKNGVVVIDDDGKILFIGDRKDFDEAALEVYQGIITPGFINSHCHLELSYLKGKIREKKGLIQFIIDLIDYRNGFTLSDESNEYLDIIYNDIRHAEAEMKENGIVGVGDISNDDYTFIFKAGSPLRYHTFVECFGFFPDKAATYFQRALDVFRKCGKLQLASSITPHAPYSVPPELLQLIFSFKENNPSIFSYHNQESEAENILFEKGSGDFLRLFDHFNIPHSLFKPTGKRSLQSVSGYFPPGKKILLVHNTYTSRSDFEYITTNENLNPKLFYFCFCPNANLFIENRLPDFSLFRGKQDRLCIGTDSYASNHQLSVLEEMKTIQRHDASLSTPELIQWATLNGAGFFGWDDELGTLEPGKKPGLNLIDSVDDSLHFTSGSKVRRLI